MLRYAITDASHFKGDFRARNVALQKDVSGWIGAGINYVQLREKDLDARELLIIAKQMLEKIRHHGDHTKLLVNSRADVALASGAHGVHLTSEPSQLGPDQVRRIFELARAEAPTVSISCHTLTDVARACKQKADLILFGPVFEKRVGKDVVAAGKGLEMLRQACAAAQDVPVFALGGVTSQSAPECLAAGASGIAGIRLFSHH